MVECSIPSSREAVPALPLNCSYPEMVASASIQISVTRVTGMSHLITFNTYSKPLLIIFNTYCSPLPVNLEENEGHKNGL